MLEVIRRVDDGPNTETVLITDSSNIVVKDGKKLVKDKSLVTKHKSVTPYGLKKLLGTLEPVNKQEVRNSNVPLNEVDEDYATIVEVYYYTDGPNEGEDNGWCQIEYRVTRFGKTIPVDEWD